MASHFVRYLLGVYVQEVLPLATRRYKPLRYEIRRSYVVRKTSTFLLPLIMSLPARPRYFTPNEVCVHNTEHDLWVSFLGKVYDLTPLCEKYKG